MHDNARPHIAKQTMDKLKTLNYEILRHARTHLISRQLISIFFKHLQNFLNGERFDHEEMLKKRFEPLLTCKSAEFYRLAKKNLPIR